MSPTQAVLLYLAGVLAGFVNTVAGGGSVVSLAILTEMVGASVANGTNRVAVLLANITSAYNFNKGGAVEWPKVRRLLIPTVVGAICGAWTASRLDSDDLKKVFAFVLLFVAASVLVKPSRWVEERQEALHEPWRTLAFLGIGFYGGFVQAGVGFLLIAGLVLGGGLDLVKGNAAKVVLIATYTAFSLAIFAGAGQVDFGLGLFLAMGNTTGAFVATKLALKKGSGWIRWFIIVAAVIAAGRMLFV